MTQAQYILRYNELSERRINNPSEMNEIDICELTYFETGDGGITENNLPIPIVNNQLDGTR